RRAVQKAEAVRNRRLPVREPSGKDFLAVVEQCPVIHLPRLDTLAGDGDAGPASVQISAMDERPERSQDEDSEMLNRRFVIDEISAAYRDINRLFVFVCIMLGL